MMDRIEAFYEDQMQRARAKLSSARIEEEKNNRLKQEAIKTIQHCQKMLYSLEISRNEEPQYNEQESSDGEE